MSALCASLWENENAPWHCQAFSELTFSPEVVRLESGCGSNNLGILGGSHPIPNGAHPPSTMVPFRGLSARYRHWCGAILYRHHPPPGSSPEGSWMGDYLPAGTQRRPVCSICSLGTLVPTWGDGSGTGTGGTFTVSDGPLKMWNGKWSPCVYQISSNCTELVTLKLTLGQLLDEGLTLMIGIMVFYSTNNSTIYQIAAWGASGSPHLHALIEGIYLLKLCLGCHLQVIHVPGLVMDPTGNRWVKLQDIPVNSPRWCLILSCTIQPWLLLM
jgi:hypothetical protein